MNIECCPGTEDLRACVRGAPAAVVLVRVLPLPSMFPAALIDAARGLPYPVSCVVATPSAVEGLGVPRPRLGRALVFGSGRLLGFMDPLSERAPETLLGVLGAGLSPALARADVPAWDDDESDPFAVIGVPRTATFDEVRAAWRRRLGEYHPDHHAQSGEKIRRVADDETRRLLSAFQEIARRMGVER